MNATILVVDDNVLNLKLTAELLEFEGFSVLRAGDAEGAKELLKTASPALILMDLQMPGQDGLSLTRELKEMIQYQKVKIVALTASVMRGDSERALNAGCDGYISKPINTREFCNEIKKFL